MFEKSINAPTGCGIHVFVAQQVLATGLPVDQITIICSVPELCRQWQRDLPGVRAVTLHKWRRAPVSSGKLIIAELAPHALAEVAHQLHTAPQPVWLINQPLPLPMPLHRPAAPLQLQRLRYLTAHHAMRAWDALCPGSRKHVQDDGQGGRVFLTAQARHAAAYHAISGDVH